MPRTPNRVYHSSQKQGLKKISPHKSTHGHNWVYATLDMVMAAAFLGTKGGDFTCAVGRDSNTDKPYICERFKGAFDLRYDGVKGSIYVLPDENFMREQTLWQEEVVAEGAVEPLAEIKVDNAKQYLLKLEKSGKLNIKYYPEKIAGIPRDDSDLVKRVVVWSQKFGDEILERVKEYHPHLLSRVKKALKEEEQVK